MNGVFGAVFKKRLFGNIVLWNGLSFASWNRIRRGGHISNYLACNNP